jgi:anti-anti-sigma factor
VALSLAIDTNSGAARVSAEGEIDVTTAPELLEAVERLGRGWDRVEMDLSGVGFMDASGLRALERACEQAQRIGFSLKVVALSKTARRVVELTKTQALLNC